jgi:hypothetical protein
MPHSILNAALRDARPLALSFRTVLADTLLAGAMLVGLTGAATATPPSPPSPHVPLHVPLHVPVSVAVTLAEMRR